MGAVSLRLSGKSSDAAATDSNVVGVVIGRPCSSTSSTAHDLAYRQHGIFGGCGEWEGQVRTLE